MNKMINKEINELCNKIKNDYREKGYTMTVMDEVMLKSGMAYGVPLVSKILASIEFDPFGDTSDITDELPSIEQYQSSKFAIAMQNDEYSEPLFKCPKCDGGMCKNLTRTLTSLPPSYEYKCDKCGHIEYLRV